MKKSLLKAGIIASILSLMLSGCGSNSQKQESSQTNETKVITQQDNIDFAKINEDVKKNFTNSQTYSMVRDSDFSAITKNGKTVITLNAIVDDSIGREKLMSLADSMLRSYGFESSSRYSQFSSPSKNSYGGIFDKYDARIMILPASDPKNKEYINTYIDAGMQTKRTIKPTSDFKG